MAAWIFVSTLKADLQSYITQPVHNEDMTNHNECITMNVQVAELPNISSYHSILIPMNPHPWLIEYNQAISMTPFLGVCEFMFTE